MPALSKSGRVSAVRWRLVGICLWALGWWGLSAAAWAAGGVAGASAVELTPVTLQLKWQHQFQFAGYYMAEARGYYRAAGLDVRIVEARPGLDPLREVLDGRAQFGVGTSGLLLARGKGEPVVVLANVFQHSALALVMRQDSPTDSIHDLVGRRVMIEPGSDELFAYLRREGIDDAALVQPPHSFDPRDLLEGRVDAMSVYITDEPFFLDQAGFRYLALSPRSAGIDFYGDNLYTTEAQIADHPDLVRAFRDASLKGWRDAMAHPDEAIELILSRYGAAHGRDYLAYEARQMQPLVRADLIEIGYSNPGRWRHIADTYASLGMLPPDVNLRGFLYDPATPALPAWLLRAVVVTAVLGLLGAALTAYILRINRRLARSNGELARAETRARESERRYRLLAEHASDVIWTLDPCDECFDYVSPSVARLRGIAPAEAQGQRLDEALMPDSAAQVRAWLAHWRQGADTDAALRTSLELEQRGADGRGVWTETSLTTLPAEDGETPRLLGISRDIAERRLMRERLDRMAHYDALTGLPNRALFFDRLSQALAIARRDQRRLALLFIDLDGFKDVNDSHGHDTGDAVLRLAARRIAGSMRASDTLARVGGDEFIAIVRDLDLPDSAGLVAGKLITSLQQPFECAGHSCQVGCSIGISLFPDAGLDDAGDALGERLVSRADMAMYAAKRAGRNTWRVWEADEGAQA